MNRMLAAAGVLAILAGQAARAAPACEYGFANVRNPPRFADYPAEPTDRTPPARPVLASPDARRFRTVLRNAAAGGPDFAGHWKVAVWGCGTACLEAALVDTRTGRVFFDERLRDVSVFHVSDPDPADGQDTPIGLRFRPDSRLLVVLGAPHEDDARDGAAFYEWTGERLRFVRFDPRAALCRAQG